MKEIIRYPHCFVCGERNPGGLQVKFFDRDGEAFAKVLAAPSFEGYKGIYHGGVISALLDEVMIKAVLARGIYAVTAELSIRYHRPVAIGDHLEFRGRIVSQRRRLFNTEGEALGTDGGVYASATGKYVQAADDLRNRLAQSVE